jgi:phage/plasmid-like protein (TIGR03299 family)
MWTGEPPWHGLGQELAGPATAEQAIKAANLDWEVGMQPVYAEGGGHSLRVPRSFAVVPLHRWGKADCPVYGLVSAGYRLLQNRDAFRFFDPIVGRDAAVYHTAGALGDGKRVWILAKLPKEILVVGDDISHKYLLLSNSHDGKSSVQIKFTPVRVVCQNTLTMALSKGPMLRVPHTGDLQEGLRQAERNLGLIHKHFDDLRTTFQAMTRITINSARLATYVKLVFPDPSDLEDEQAVARVHRDRAIAAHLFQEGHGNDSKGVAGTLWAAYNGVVESVDFAVSKRTDKERLEHIWFGNGYLLKARAFETAKRQLLAWRT